MGWWDPVAGLTFPLPGHAERFAQLEAGRPHTATRNGGRRDTQAGDRQAGDRQAGDRQGDAGQQDNPRSRRGGERERDRSSLLSPRRAGPPRAFDDVLATVHRIAASPDAATAFVFQDVDHHLPPGQPESNPGYLRLRAAMTDAVTPRQTLAGRRPHARNAVLCAVGDVGRLPGWFHLEDPRIATLHIGPPDPSERRLWLTWLRGDFNGAPTAARHD
ncbi:ATP-dependent Clp protease ATP-binding subunit, partial [Streptomyces sp. MCAF7]